MINQENLPEIMKKDALWCVCKFGDKGKIPFNAKTVNGENCCMAKTNDRETFTDFETAFACYQYWTFDGLGMGIFNGFCAIDIDDCIQDGSPSDMARDIFEEMNSYTEISPSGEGIHIVFKVKDFQYDRNKYYIMNNKIGLEIYIPDVTNKYVTITGDVLGNNEVIVANEALQKILDKYMLRDVPVAETTSNTSSDSDDTLRYLEIGLKKDKKLIRYWKGYRNNTSESQNDLGFMRKLMYWCNNDKDKAIQVFLASPYAKQKDESHKKKIQREDYLQVTANTAWSERTAAKDYAEKFQYHVSKEENKNSPVNQYNTPLISAVELQQMELPPTQYLVEDILPEGTCILVAPPKIGKSWFVLDMGMSIALGKEFLGKQTHAVGVLYFALEDSNRRLQDRMNKVISYNSPPPSNFYFQTEAPTLDNSEFLNLLENYIKTTDIKLVIIDTLQKIRRQEKSHGSAYQQDYQDVGELKRFADKHNISIFLVHHTRKMKDDDPYNMISGTNGIMGAADTAFIITKTKRTDENAVMNITGRDVEQNDFVIHFDTLCFRWRMSGTLDEINTQEEKSRYENNPIVLTIISLLKHDENHQWTGISKNLKSEAEKLGYKLPHTPQKLKEEVENLSRLLFRYDKIIYKPRSNGNAGVIHHFEYYDLPDYTPKEDIFSDDRMFDEDDIECDF